MKLGLYWLLSFSSVYNLVYGLNAETFDEKLKIIPLQDGRVSTTFTFETLLKGVSPRDPRTLNAPDVCTRIYCPISDEADSASIAQHYTLFPLALGQILREYAVTELHLTLNAGSWNYEHWGYPEEKGVGTGAELWAWMGTGAPTRYL